MAASTAAIASSTSERCERAPDGPPGLHRCRVGLADEVTLGWHQTQERSNWCWAASLAMIFRHHGHTLSQAQIAAQVSPAAADSVRSFGSIDRRPTALRPLAAADPHDNHAASKLELLRALDRPWPSAEGRGLMTIRTRPVVRSRNAVERRANTEFVRQELASGHPLLLGMDDHAVVLVRLEYERLVDEHGAEISLRVTGGQVADPRLPRAAEAQPPPAFGSPMPPGLRRLQPRELRPTMLIALRVTAEPVQAPHIVTKTPLQSD